MLDGRLDILVVTILIAAFAIIGYWVIAFVVTWCTYFVAVHLRYLQLVASSGNLAVFGIFIAFALKWIFAHC